jgi:hypothetical protein
VPLSVAKRVGLDCLLLILDIPEIASLFALEKSLPSLVISLNTKYSSRISYLLSAFTHTSTENNIQVIKSIRMKWSGHAARMGESRGAYRFWRKLREEDYLEAPGVEWEDNIKMVLQGMG